MFASDDWEHHLVRAEKSSMRSQWTRAWLLGPMGAANFADRSVNFGDAVLCDDAQRLARLLIWFQAEKTRPNPLILPSRCKRWAVIRDIEQAADAYGVPSDYFAWNRCCNWILDNIGRCSVTIISDIVSVLEVWQNAFADFPNETSDRILDQTKIWLEDIEDRSHPEQFRYDLGRWQALGRGILEELESRLRAMLLRAARARPEIAGTYPRACGPNLDCADTPSNRLCSSRPFSLRGWPRNSWI